MRLVEGVIWQEWPEDTAVIVFVTREGLPQAVGRVPIRPEDNKMLIDC